MWCTNLRNKKQKQFSQEVRRQRGKKSMTRILFALFSYSFVTREARTCRTNQTVDWEKVSSTFTLHLLKASAGNSINPTPVLFLSLSLPAVRLTLKKKSVTLYVRIEGSVQARKSADDASARKKS